MKRLMIILITLCFISVGLWALDGEIVYVSGTVDFRSASGRLDYADFGMILREGDSLITGYDGEAELSLPNGSTVNISPDTVFTFSRASLSPGGQPENVFDVVRGQVAFKFNRLGDQEPSVRGRSAVAGVRGTEFTVVVGADGQSLFVVSEGAVEVSAAGRSVELAPSEGVQVNLETGVGEKFPALEGEIDFSGFLAEADANALADPAGTLAKLITLMEEYLDAAESYRLEFDESRMIQENLQEDIAALREEGKEEEADRLVEVFQIEKGRASTAGLNYRYYVLSVQSLRRFVVAELYVSQRSNSFIGSAQEIEFMQLYELFREIYNERTTRLFVVADV
jgi:hypothetical protein